MRLILAMILLATTATTAFAGGSTHTTLTCYPIDKNVLFGKYPVGNSKMRCVQAIEDGKEQRAIEETLYELTLKYSLVASFMDKDRVVLIFDSVRPIVQIDQLPR